MQGEYLLGGGLRRHFFPYIWGFRKMDVMQRTHEDIDLPSLMQPPDADNCEGLSCPNCEVLKDRLKQLSYCLAVAQRLTNLEA